MGGNVMEKSDHILSIIASALAIIAAVNASILSSKQKYILSIVLWIVCALLFVITIVTIYVSAIKKRHALFYRKLKYALTPKGTHIVACRTIYYEYKDREHMDHNKQFRVIPRCVGFDTFTDRYVFSGDGFCKVKAAFPNQRIVDTYKDHGWNFYSIKLDSPVPKKQTVCFGMEMDTIYDPDHNAKPFLSTGIYEATQKLSMTVKFGNGLIPHNPKLKVFADYIDRTPIYESELQYNSDTHSIEYNIDYPVYRCKYLIIWNFDDDGKINNANVQDG